MVVIDGAFFYKIQILVVDYIYKLDDQNNLYYSL